MLYWICPECGRECSPAIRDCPACSGTAESERHPSDSLAHVSESRQEMLTLAEHVKPTQTVPGSELSLDTAGTATLIVDGPAAPAEKALTVLAEETPSIPLKESIDSLVRPLVESAEPATEFHAQPVLESIGARLEAEQAAKRAAEEEVKRVADEVARRAAEEEAKRAAEEAARHAAEEEAKRAAEEAARRAAEEEAKRVAQEAARRAAEEEAKRAAEEAARRATQEEARRVAQEEARRAAATAKRHAAEQAATVQAASRALALHAEPIIESITAHLEAEQSAIRAFLSSFTERPSTGLLTAPTELVTAPAPPDLAWIRTERPTILPLSLEATSPVGPSLVVPQLSTLAGPALPPELRNLTEWRAGAEGRSRKAIGFPTWIISVLAATALFLITGILLQYFSGNRNAAAAVTPVSQPGRPSASSAPVVSVAQDSLSRMVEISGLRLITGWNHKQQVAFLVVNHSTEQLPATSIQVAVRSPDSGTGSTPILSINAVIHGLGPNQSKEIRTDLDSTVPSSMLADWQSLRTDVQVASHE
jgi:chemotaxis protein histidine kinase CheA